MPWILFKSFLCELVLTCWCIQIAKELLTRIQTLWKYTSYSDFTQVLLKVLPQSNRQSPSLCRFSFFDLVKGSWAPRVPSQTCLLENPSSSWFLSDCLMLKGWAIGMDMWCNLYFYLLRISTLVTCPATFTTRRPLRCNRQTGYCQLGKSACFPC